MESKIYSFSHISSLYLPPVQEIRSEMKKYEYDYPINSWLGTIINHHYSRKSTPRQPWTEKKHLDMKIAYPKITLPHYHILTIFKFIKLVF